MEGKDGDSNQCQPNGDNTHESPHVTAAEEGQNLKADPSGKQAETGDSKESPLPPPWYERFSLTDWITAISTLVIMVWAGLQWGEMHGSGGQTEKLIKAANISACAAAKNAAAAQSFATSAGQIKEGIQNAVSQLGTQVGKMDASIIQAKRLASDTETANANVMEADRPWIGASLSVDGFAVGKTPTYTVIFVNSGKRPARVTLTQTLSVPIDYKGSPKYNPYDTTPSVTVVVPNQPLVASWKDENTRNPISEDLMKDFTSGTTPFRVYAKIEYTDMRTNINHWTHVCWRYTPRSTAVNSGFSNCNEYNDAK